MYIVTDSLILTFFHEAGIASNSCQMILSITTTYTLDPSSPDAESGTMTDTPFSCGQSGCDTYVRISFYIL